MSRYIDRYKTIDTLQRSNKDPIDVLFEQPDADVRENVRGEWIRKKDTTCCSNCGAKWTDHIGLTDTWYYCPNCGADMRGGNNG